MRESLERGRPGRKGEKERGKWEKKKEKRRKEK